MKSARIKIWGKNSDNMRKRRKKERIYIENGRFGVENPDNLIPTYSKLARGHEVVYPTIETIVKLGKKKRRKR